MKKNRRQFSGEQRDGFDREVKFLLFYTLVFALASVSAFRFFPEHGKYMVWKQDGLTQHYTALCYFSRWGRSVLKSILHGSPSFPTFNLHIGYGADLLTTLQYYVIGDPFSLPAVFVPQKYMLAFHDAMMILRLYVAGICFDRYCCKMGYRGIVWNLCGAVVYLFGNYTLFGIRHPYFLNALIWFPLLLIGAENILRGGRGRLFSAAVFLSCISNFYFFYMLVLLTVMYVIWRTLRICLFPVLFGHSRQPSVSDRRPSVSDRSPSVSGRKPAGSGRQLSVSDRSPSGLGRKQAGSGRKPTESGRQPAESGRRPVKSGRRPNVGQGPGYGLTEAWEQIGQLILRFLVRGILGVGMGMCLFLPVILRFLSDPRTAGSSVNALFYPTEYYTGFAEAFVSYGTKTALENWTCMGFGAAGLLGVLVLFLGRKGRHFDLKAAWIVMLAMTLFPAAGTILNGFKYPANRWGWAFTLLCAFITVAVLPEISGFSPGRMAVLFIFLGIYAGGCQLAGATKETMMELLLAAAAAILMRLFWGPAVRKRMKRINSAKSGSRDGAAVNAGKQSYGQAQSRRIRVRKAVFSCVPLCAAVLTVSIHGYECYERGVSFSHSDIRNYSSAAFIKAMVSSDAAAMRKLIGPVTGSEFYRYSARDLLNNYSILHDVSNTQYFWSLSDSRIGRFFAETGQPNGLVDLYDNLDNRTMLDEIAGVKYYKRNDGSLLPYGYQKMEGIKYDNKTVFSKEELENEKESVPIFRFSIYENRYALPLGFTSDRYIAGADWKSLTIPRRQEALMQGIVIEDDRAEGLAAEGSAKKADPVFTEKEIPFELLAEGEAGILQADENEVKLQNSGDDGWIDLKLKESGDAAGCETGVLFTDMRYEPLSAKNNYSSTTPVKIYVKARRKGKTLSSKEVQYSLEDNPWGTGRVDFLSCCGYSEDSLQKIRLTFSRPGIYTFRELKIIGQPMEAYTAQAEALKACVLEDLDLHEVPGSGATSRITGRIRIPGAAGDKENSRILCIQVPRLDGFTAYVDGKRAELFEADTMFSGLLLEPGEHKIELRYHTPGLSAGMLISVVCLILFMAEGALRGRRMRQRKTAGSFF